MLLQLFIPGQLTSPANASRWSYWTRSKWAQGWRQRARVAWLEAGKPTWAGPARVHFVGYVARRFDDDNFPGCVKACRDQVVRDVLGTDDGPTCGHVFTYEQTVEPGKRGVLVQITPREGA